MLGEARRRRRAAGGTGENASIPAEILPIRRQKVAPARLGTRAGRAFDEGEGTSCGAIRLGDFNLITEVFAGGGFQPNLSQKLVVGRRWFFPKDRKPSPGIVDLNRVQAIARQAVEEFAVIAHQPDD